VAYRSIYSLLPDADALLALEPEELAGTVLEHLNSLPPDMRGRLNRYNFGLPGTYGEYPQQKHSQIAQALMEAWVWLEREGMLAPTPGQPGDWFFVTRRGKQAANGGGLEAYRNAALLPHKQLHPVIAQKCWSAFLRGEYDTAVFQAYKELEVAIRRKANLSAEDIGTELARKAFRTKTGPLTDTRMPLGEQESLAHLVAGAIGLYKNPHSHRKVELQADEAVEMISLASHLMKIVDAHPDQNAGNEP
jgi:uncharacterized protein (TIGR02391 family)